MEANPYEILEISMTATEAEIKSSYRRLVALYHPDNNPGFPVEATQKIREINEAYVQARGGWRPPVGLGASPRPAPSPHQNPPRRWDPPKPPPKPVGPKVPPPRYTDVPPPRSGPPRERDAPGAADRARRAAFVADLVAVGFFTGPSDAVAHPAVVDAFVPLFAEGAHLRSCARYDGLVVTGPTQPPRHETGFLHAVPSAAVGGEQARQDAVGRIIRAQFVACTDDHVFWSVSGFAAGDEILLREDIAVTALPFDDIAGHDRRRGELRITTSAGATVAFHLDRRAAERLDAALGAAC